MTACHCPHHPVGCYGHPLECNCAKDESKMAEETKGPRAGRQDAVAVLTNRVGALTERVAALEAERRVSAPHVMMPSVLGTVTFAQPRPADCPRANCCGSVVQIGAASVSVCGIGGCKHNHNPTHGGCGKDLLPNETARADDQAVERTLGMSDEQIVAEMRAAGLDPDEEAASVKRSFERAAAMIDSLPAWQRARVGDRVKYALVGNKTLTYIAATVANIAEPHNGCRLALDGHGWADNADIISILPPEPERPGRIGGYAPGNYECICHSCEAHFIGDKRAIQCVPCAQKQIAAERPEDEPTLVEAVQELRDLTKAHGLSFGDDAQAERQETAPSPASLDALKAEATDEDSSPIWKEIFAWHEAERSSQSHDIDYAVDAAIRSIVDRAYALDRAEQPQGETPQDVRERAFKVVRARVGYRLEASEIVEALASAGLLASQPQRVTVNWNAARDLLYAHGNFMSDGLLAVLKSIPGIVIEGE